MSDKETFPPTPPYRENRTRTRTGSGMGTGSGTGARAGDEASRSGSGTVGFRQKKGSGTVRIDRDLFFDPLYDPVQIALLALSLPQKSTDANGRTYNNARIMRSYVRRLGEDAFRELAYRQWRENAIDGEPRSRAAAFMAKLWNSWKGPAVPPSKGDGQTLPEFINSESIRELNTQVGRADRQIWEPVLPAATLNPTEVRCD